MLTCKSLLNTPFKNRLFRLTLSASILVLAACGGGSETVDGGTASDSGGNGATTTADGSPAGMSTTPVTAKPKEPASTPAPADPVASTPAEPAPTDPTPTEPTPLAPSPVEPIAGTPGQPAPVTPANPAVNPTVPLPSTDPVTEVPVTPAQPVAGSNEICEGFYLDSFQLTMGFDDSSRPSPGTKPVKGAEQADPVYGTCIVRMTDHANEPPNNFARAEYSRKQSINADNTRLIAFANDGYWHIYDANTGDHIKVLNGPAGAAELRWDVNDPNTLYFMDTNGGMQVYQLDLDSNSQKTIGDFTGRLPWPNAARVWTKAEGTHSADGRYWGMQVETENFEPLGLVVWDKQNDRIVGTWDFAANGVGRPDHASMSPSGEYIVASWDGNDLGTTAFSRDFSTQVQLHTKSEHSDLALLSNGNDAYVAVDYQSNNGDVFMVEIQTGERTALFESYIDGTVSSFHFSGKAFKRPGWVLVSSYGEGEKWLHRKVFAVELKENPEIRHIAHHQVAENGYWTEPHATVNQDFTRVLFNSNWGNNSETDVDIYQVKLPYSAME